MIIICPTLLILKINKEFLFIVILKVKNKVILMLQSNSIYDQVLVKAILQVIKYLPLLKGFQISYQF